MTRGVKGGILQSMFLFWLIFAVLWFCAMVLLACAWALWIMALLLWVLLRGLWRLAFGRPVPEPVAWSDLSESEKLRYL